MSIDEIRKAFRSVTFNRTANIFKISASQPVERGGLRDAFGWLQIALEIGSGAAMQAAADQASSRELSAKLDSWLTRTETDTDPKEFIEQFNTFSLPTWDHYTHIRIAYTLLTTYGRKEGMSSFLGSGDSAQMPSI